MCLWGFAVPFSSLSNLCIYMLDWNQFAEPNRHVYFSSSYFNLQVTCCALSGVALTIWMFFFFAVLWRSATSTVSFLFPSEWKTMAWKLFHRASLLFQSKIVNISLYWWFYRHCAYLPIQVLMLRPSCERALWARQMGAAVLERQMLVRLELG